MKHLELIEAIRTTINEPTDRTWTYFDLLETRLQQELSATQLELETLRRARARLGELVACKNRGANPDPTSVRTQLSSIESSFRKRINVPADYKLS